jgi:hypothetical protein
MSSVSPMRMTELMVYDWTKIQQGKLLAENTAKQTILFQTRDKIVEYLEF